jgi:hypothetical protein
LRRAVAEEVRLQFTPELRFLYDTASDHAAKIDRLFRDIAETAPEGSGDESLPDASDDAGDEEGDDEDEEGDDER